MKKYTLIIAISGLLCIPQATRAMEKKLTPTNMSAYDAAQLRKAVIDYKKDRSRGAAQAIINYYSSTHPNDPLVKAKINEIVRFKKAEDISLTEEEISITEEESLTEQACAICMEDQNMVAIPCKNKHNDLICNSCLAQIKNSNNLCPICREPLLN